jgi:thiosulfate dehydrogenase
MKNIGLTTRASLLLSLAFVLFGFGVEGCYDHPARAASSGRDNSAASADQPSPLAVQGKLIFDETPKYAHAYVGNKLACSDCHIQSGTAAHAAPMIDLAGLFPMFNKRAGHVISIENRIQECFTRSEAGSPPATNSPEVQALVAYIDWLSRGGEKGKAWPGRGLVKIPTLTGDPVAGKVVYAAQCAGCHGANGAGVPPILPAVWGNDSFNDGAGMNKPAKMAAFVLHNMPQNHPGTLSPQQAWDVSAYIHTMPRPKFDQAYKLY